jgi:hypothetical protein
VLTQRCRCVSALTTLLATVFSIWRLWWALPTACGRLWDEPEADGIYSDVAVEDGPAVASQVVSSSIQRAWLLRLPPCPENRIYCLVSHRFAQGSIHGMQASELISTKSVHVQLCWQWKSRKLFFEGQDG